jgi:NRAMP (natural resistance-associated macrophage protein)-like metal ion transporter
VQAPKWTPANSAGQYGQRQQQQRNEVWPAGGFESVAEFMATKPAEAGTGLTNAEDVLLRLGPGLVTGAADDDPSGIATYSQAGAQFGFSMLWVMLFSFPLMAAIQEICGRLGRITGMGVAANLAKCYPKAVVRTLVSLLCFANIFNLGADVTAMGGAIHLVIGGAATAYALIAGAISLLLQIYVPYRRYVRYLKWLTWALFAYVSTAFVVRVPWLVALRATVIPSISFNEDYLMVLIAVLGTTISPYLFFWQASQEVEDVELSPRESPLIRKPSGAFGQLRRIALDTRIGMALSNIVAFFIILTTAATLHGTGTDAVNHIRTAADAAKALEPLAGHFATLLFAMGIVGTGMLAIPVLAGSAGYAVSETFGWKASLESKPRNAKRFYWVIAGSTLLGVGLTLLRFDPIRALFLSALLNGLVAVPLMFLLLMISVKPNVVGKFPLPLHLRIGGWAATAMMAAASLGFFVSTFYHLIRR